ncbi:MAG: SMP-30/gluconolactonase/LRE family protein [Candidatus Aminicenantes bacterium]|nr:MAG: SMP-30/gluconolactonase/LRE family protein [Candidatus Aminicenantes bacterium]
MSFIIFVLVALVAILLLYLLFWPVPIKPAAWTPPEVPALIGIYKPNRLLANVERLGTGAGFAPETAIVDDQGRIYAGMGDGLIMRFQKDGSQPEVLAETGGRPLGLRFDQGGNLAVCDAFKGLLSIDQEGSVSVLCSKKGDIPIHFANDLDIASDGTIFFSDSTSRFPIDKFMLDMMEHRNSGRLLAFDPKTNSTHVVLDNLYFANGVAVSPDQTFVLVAESWKYRIQRFWLEGPKKGESEIFIDNLPGFPDNITSNGKDLFWLAIIQGPETRRGLDALLPKPFLRKLMMRVPLIKPPVALRDSLILGLDKAGRVASNLQDPEGNFAQITNVTEFNGMLYLGSISESSIGRIPVPKSRESESQ